MTKKTGFMAISLVLIGLLAVQGAFAAGSSEPAAAGRTGTAGRVDSVVFREQATQAAGISMLQAGEIDIYAFPIANAELFRRITGDRTLGFERSFGSYDEITFNPVGPTFPGTGKLNPFSVPRIREAMNYIIDRTYIAQELYGGLANPRFTAVNTAVPDYTRMIETNRKIELLYAYNLERGQRIIDEEMAKLGATKVGGVWQFKGEAVSLIFVIRTEDTRRQIGDYVANQLEKIGFKVERLYKTGAEASPLWINGDPNAGLFHLYTGGWVSTVISRDLASNFDFFYTPRGLSAPLWTAYKPSAEFDKVAKDLADSKFTTTAERTQLFAKALELSMKDSVRIFTTDRIGAAPRRANVSVAADLSGSISGTPLWAQTVRFTDGKSGLLNIAMPSMLPDPWNPIGGSNWIYDQMIIRATMDYPTLANPYTGLAMPQRIKKAEITMQEGIPVSKTDAWVTLAFEKEIKVPADAWISWDAAAQTFRTVAQVHPGGLTAKRKSVVYFEDNLLTKRWHDGSTLSLADLVLNLILTFDRGIEGSPSFDKSYGPQYNQFLTQFKGARIVSRNPVIIEYYADNYTPDAENNVTTLWPNWGFGSGAWHQMAVALKAEQAKELAFTKAKADELKVEWTSFIAGPSIRILNKHFAEARTQGFIPYQATLGQFITPAEVTARYNNLQAWVNAKNHYWIGLGPFQLDRAFPVEKMVRIERFASYADPIDKWARFAAPPIAEVDLTGPARFAAGAAASFVVDVTFGGRPYRAADIESVTYLLFNGRGELVKVGPATPVKDGQWKVDLTAADTRALGAGSNRIEIAVASKIVSIPSFDQLQFSTTN